VVNDIRRTIDALRAEGILSPADVFEVTTAGVRAVPPRRR
jgi:hypothetical protein